MTDDNKSKSAAECNLIQKMQDARFINVEEDVHYLQKGFAKTSDILADVKEAIVRLTVLQETQQEALQREKDILAETIERQAQNLSKQNQVFEESMSSQRQLLEALLNFNVQRDADLKSRTEITGKKIAAIAAIVSSFVAAVAAVIVGFLS